MGCLRRRFLPRNMSKVVCLVSCGGRASAGSGWNGVREQSVSDRLVCQDFRGGVSRRRFTSAGKSSFRQSPEVRERRDLVEHCSVLVRLQALLFVFLKGAGLRGGARRRRCFAWFLVGLFCREGAWGGRVVASPEVLGLAVVSRIESVSGRSGALACAWVSVRSIGGGRGTSVLLLRGGGGLKLRAGRFRGGRGSRSSCRK